MSNFFVIAPLSALSRRTRLFKLAKFVARKFPYVKITHIGWERARGERVETQLQDIEIVKEILIQGGAYGGIKTRLIYFLWMLLVFLRCLSIKKNDSVWALGFESAFPALLASKIRRFKVYFDDADRFSMIFSFPKPLKKIIEILERYTSRNAFIHIIPGAERYDFESAKFHLLKNMPSETELDQASKIYKEKTWPAASLVINVNGWLGAGRGMDAALMLAKEFPTNLAIIVAGKLDCPAAEELVALPNTYYLGQVSNAEALASYYASDLVLTYYSPTSRINRLAESNKWGDAIKVGIGVIVNSEVETADYLRKAGIAISVPYTDHEALKKAMLVLTSDPEQQALLKKKAHHLAQTQGYFEEQLEALFAKAPL